MSYKNRLNKIAERLDYLEGKVNIGHYTFAEVQERDRLVFKYLELEKSFAETIKAKAGKIQAIINQMSRHENLNKEDMPLVCEILQREVNSILSK